MGLPFHHHWDEVWIADGVADMVRHGNDVPRSYQYVAPLFRLTEFAFVALCARRLPFEPTVEDAQVTIYLLARVVTAIIASSGAVAVYWAASASEPIRSRRPLVGLGSALAYATAWELVLHSRYGVTDACLVGLTVFLFFNPHVIDRACDAAHDILGRMAQTRNGGSSAVYLRRPGLPHLASALWAIASNFLHRSAVVSLVATAIACGGVVSAVRRKSTLMAVAVVHAVAVTLAVALPNRVFWIRNYLVVIPCLCLGFGQGLSALVEVVRTRLGDRPRQREMATAAIAVAVVFAFVVMPVAYAVAAERSREDPRTRALDWTVLHSTESAALVGTSPGVFSSRGLGTYPGIRDLETRPNLRFTPNDLESCPPSNEPDYIVDASYRDVHKADAADPYGPTWFFRSCPGYEEVATFDDDPYEYDLDELPTWVGRVSVVVLRRIDALPATGASR